MVAGSVYLVLTVLVAAEATDRIDEAWNDLMVDLETSWLVDVADVFRVLGSTTVALATAVVGVALLVARRRWRDGLALAAIAVGAFVVGQLTKVIVDRPRPPDALEVETSASYPSASVMVSAAGIVLGFAVLAGRCWPRSGPTLTTVAVVYVVVMAWSRTYLRAHWFTDVIGGAAGGVAVVALTVVGVAAIRGRTRMNSTPASL